jgi:sulfate adenylyltransferase
MNEPYGGTLVNLLTSEQEADELRRDSPKLPAIVLPERARLDLYLIATGAMSPLDGFMNQRDYESVVRTMRLANGVLFPIPVMLPVADGVQVAAGDCVALRDANAKLLAVMDVDEVYEWDAREFAANVLGTDSDAHPLEREMAQWGRRNIAGKLRVLPDAAPVEFRALQLTPAQVRERLAALNAKNVIAFQTRNPLHRAHEALIRHAQKQVGGVVLLHPAAGLTQPGDVDVFARVRAYRALAEKYFEPHELLMAVLPLAMRMAGPREAVWHAIIRRNFGATHFIVGRDHAGPGHNIYPPAAAQELALQHAEELGVTILPFEEMVYAAEQDAYVERSRVPEGATIRAISGTEARRDYLDKGVPLPEWYTRPEVAEILRETYPPRSQQGVCVWLTGLSGAGKTATSEVLIARIRETGRRVTVLDGDVVRRMLSPRLGFTRADRDEHIMRVAFVASEVVRHGGVAVVAAISPYRETRENARRLIGPERFIEVFVDTPVEVCAQRDVKGLYRRKTSNLTGVDDPYEPPERADVVLETTRSTIEENAEKIYALLRERGYVEH